MRRCDDGDDSVPLKITSLYSLPKPTYGSMRPITLQSDRYIVISEVGKEIIIVDLREPTKVKHVLEVRPKHTQLQVLPCKGVSVIYALMNPTRKIIALQFESYLKLFNVERKKTMKLFNVSVADVLLIKWIDSDTISFVTPKAIYHWKLLDDSYPFKAYDHHENYMTELLNSKIVDYRIDGSGKFFFLSGLHKVGVEASAFNSNIKGTITLYSVEKNVLQQIGGTAACFLSFKVTGNPHSSNLFCLSSAQGDANNTGKLYIVELYMTEGNKKYKRKVLKIDYDNNDYPFALEGSSTHGIIYLLTKMGGVLIFEVEQGMTLYRISQLCTSYMVATKLSSPVSGILAVNHAFQVIKITIDEELMLRYVNEVLQDRALASMLKTRFNKLSSVTSNINRSPQMGGPSTTSDTIPDDNASTISSTTTYSNTFRPKDQVSKQTDSTIPLTRANDDSTTVPVPVTSTMPVSYEADSIIPVTVSCNSNQTIIRLGRYCIQASELGNKLQISSENGQFNEFHLNEHGEVRIGRYRIQASEHSSKLQITSENGKFSEFHLNECGEFSLGT